jgi:ATP-dependent protease Clp ATPase subunit
MLRCSFCDKDEDQVAKLVAGPDVYICDVCVAIAARLMRGRFNFLKRLWRALRAAISHFAVSVRYAAHAGL